MSSRVVLAVSVVALTALHQLLPAGQWLGIAREALGIFSLAISMLLILLCALAFSPLALPFRTLPQGKPRRGLLHERWAAAKAQERDFDAIVIGSGMGGLTCSSTLARFGKRVLVLEQHDVAGGGTHTFVLDGKTDFNFDSGLHYTVPQSAELLQLACGTRRKPLEFEKLGADDGCFDKVVLGDVTEDGFRIKHAQAHLDELRRMFPDPADQEDLDRFLKVATRINALIPVWLISKAFPAWARRLWKQMFLGTFSEYARQTGEQVTRRLVRNPKLAALLCGLWMDAGCPPYNSSFVMTAALSVGFPKEGGAYPTGGSEGMASCLVQSIEETGGRVLVRARVQEILTEPTKNASPNKGASYRAVGVKMEDGTCLHAPIIVSACGFGNTYMRLLPTAAIPPGFVDVQENDAKSLPSGLRNSASWIMANLGIRASPEELGLECTNVWVQPCDESNKWDLFQGIRDYFERPLSVPTMPLMITFPSLKDRAASAEAGGRPRLTCQMLALAGEGWFDEWEKENGQHPAGGEYDTLKKQWLDSMLAVFIKRYPAAKDKIELADLSTPLSIKWYLNKPGGGAVGLDITPNRFCDDRTEQLLDMQSPIEGLWLTGEDTLLCGQPMAQLSGLLTSFRIVGLKSALSFVLWTLKLAISDFLSLD